MTAFHSNVKIYTDGGCDKNPGGTGGWAFRLVSGDQVLEKSGRVENTTNNRMELLAAINALTALTKPSEVELFTDSQYLSRGMNEWIHGWLSKNWKLKDGSPVKNDDLWKQLYELDRKHKVTWTWIRGHADSPDNVQVDRLVKAAIKAKIAADNRSVSGRPLSSPVVKINKSKGKPTAVIISLEPVGGMQVDTPVSFKIEPVQLPKLIEDLLAALRKIEES
jgi:ribonuclease HI